MSRIILTSEALASVIKNAILNVEGVKDTFGKNPIKCSFEDSVIDVEVNVVAKFGFDLKKLGENIAEAVKIEVENITPFKVRDVVVVFGDVVYES